MDDKLAQALLEADMQVQVDDKQAPAFLGDDMLPQVDDMLASASLEDCKLTLAFLEDDKLVQEDGNLP